MRCVRQGTHANGCAVLQGQRLGGRASSTCVHIGTTVWKCRQQVGGVLVGSCLTFLENAMNNSPSHGQALP